MQIFPHTTIFHESFAKVYPFDNLEGNNIATTSL